MPTSSSVAAHPSQGSPSGEEDDTGFWTEDWLEAPLVRACSGQSLSYACEAVGQCTVVMGD